ncbi:MAG: UDP-N-acetylglucosamine 1-carboxyvinyltransferase, partial [Clostridia bacterium]|nr:UDP-N-acetylglucosamine 1-carboxyvinyltransferase [Clostridia bacterium]
MSYISVSGNKQLSGTVTIQGAKNSILPILSAAILCQTPCVIHNCPQISDVDACIGILEHLGCKISRQDHMVSLDPSSVICCAIPDELMGEMRSSIVFLGAILARCGETVLSFPGGCELGPRPIDLHLNALRQMGAVVEEAHGKLFCMLPKGHFCGADILLPIPSVGATENIMIAATLAKGKTMIRNAAREPEIEDLAAFINACGGRVYGSGESTIVVEGVSSLTGCEHHIIPDRIVAATYMSAIAVTGGVGVLKKIKPQHIYPVLPFFRQSGCDITQQGDSLTIRAPRRLAPLKHIVTGYYPGFPTDSQPIIMPMATVADGTSTFVENIFESRFHHVHELVRMGAKIKVEGRMAVVEGVQTLSGTTVKARDLRGGAGLVLAGLAADGTTKIDNTHFIARGYEDIVTDLLQFGADVQ